MMKTYCYTEHEAKAMLETTQGIGFYIDGDKWLLPADYVDSSNLPKGDIYEFNLVVDTELKSLNLPQVK